MNGISDRDLVVILEVKEKHEGRLTFNPQQMQPMQPVPNQPRQGYNNVILGWNDRSALRGIQEILQRLAPEEKS
jgi:hypothetical protein